jgi:hypothetical protein
MPEAHSEHDFLLKLRSVKEGFVCKNPIFAGLKETRSYIPCASIIILYANLCGTL